MHSPLTENADGSTVGEKQHGLVIDQHTFDDLDHLATELGVSTVRLYKAGHSVEACREMLMAARHVGRAATLVSNTLRQCGRPATRKPANWGWTRELTKDPCVEKVRALA